MNKALKKGFLGIMLIAGFLNVSGQNARIISFQDLEKTLNSENDTLYVINFWATWCKPCVAELPFFEAAHHSFSRQQVKILLVSMDFLSDYESRLLPFLKKKKMDAEVVLLKDSDYNSWIDKVSPLWSGAIPATIFVRGSKQLKEFHEGEYTEQELFSKIDTYIQTQP